MDWKHERDSGNENENENDDNDNTNVSSSDDEQPMLNEPKIRRSTRVRKTTEKMREIERNRAQKRSIGLSYKDETNISMFLTEFNELNNQIQNDPLTYDEAINRNDRDCWIKAMNDEINSLEKHGTWEIRIPPKDANIISTCFIYKIKRLADNSIEKYKARLVVQGFTQKDGIDFWSDDLFAPTARLTTI